MGTIIAHIFRIYYCFFSTFRINRHNYDVAVLDLVFILERVVNSGEIVLVEFGGVDEHVDVVVLTDRDAGIRESECLDDGFHDEFVLHEFDEFLLSRNGGGVFVAPRLIGGNDAVKLDEFLAARGVALGIAVYEVVRARRNS